MINYLNPALKPFIILLAVTLLFSGCKKDELTVTELGNMAEAKLKEIQTLSADIPCSLQNEVAVQEISTGCSVTYYPVKAADQVQFNKLKKEYFDLLGKQADAMVKQGVMIDPCFESIWVSEQPIRLECKADKVELITSGNISIEEAKILATQSYEEIMAAVNAQTCTSGSEWVSTALIKDKIMKVEFIPYLRTQDYSALKKKVSLYNGLKARIIEAQGPIDFVRNELKVESIDCINGKPVIKLNK
ncbi:hypothetical protein [Pedobacter heparinus]|uniref:hypothetical protein n=1 Tax=Pedobacter heparinus TaxID=984 RepID=UPI00292E3431|nr:hypothetical protein [Pedobacter heparinus]